MSDFIIQLGRGVSPDKIQKCLQNRPRMAHREIHCVEYEWGQVILQETADAQYTPYKDDGSLVGCVGRPRFLGGRQRDKVFCSRLNDQWLGHSSQNSLLDSLTGMFALLRVTHAQIFIIRDHMGTQPVYSAYTAAGDLVGIGTDVETLALIAGRDMDFDAISLGELLVHNSITFPFSSRQGIHEFEPGACVTISFHKGQPNIEEQVYWTPKELATPQIGLVDELVDRMRETGSDIAASADAIGVTLSGGLDSRAVLSVLPKDQVTAITYVTHENYETDVAQDVARAYGCNHIFARRSEDYFQRLLLSSGPELLGTERRAMIHGLCIPESGLDDQFDVILGGQLSDTYLKDHYMPKWQREFFRPKGTKESLGVVLRRLLNIPQPIHLPGIGSNLGRYRLEKYLSPEIRQQVRSRRAKRLETVRELRPQTAEEWVKFWPTSRQDDLAHIMGNSKLFSFETLFSHRYIIDFATKLLPEDRYAGSIASQAFSILYGKLGDVQDANTGRRPGDTALSGAKPVKNGPDKSIDTKRWNNVSDSWFDMVALQKFAPQWQSQRERLVQSSAMEILDPIIDRSAPQLMQAYAEDLGPTFNQMFFQLAMAIDDKQHK